MIIRSKRNILFIALLLVTLFCCRPVSHSVNLSKSPQESLKPVQISILFFNDIHGYLKPFSVTENGQRVERGGIARIATLVRSIKSQNSAIGVSTVVLVAGDILQGTPMSTVFKGEPDIRCLNMMEVDAMTVGNHEFDFGMTNFNVLKEAAQFPFLSSNIVRRETGKRLCPAFTTLTINENFSLSIIGVTTPQLMTTTKPSNVRDLSILNPVQAVLDAQQAIPDTNPIILLSHSEARIDESIAEALPELSAIIGGHDQILMNPRKLVNSVPIFQAFEKGRYLGRLDLKLTPGNRKAEITNWEYIPITPKIADAADIASVVNEYDSKLDSTFKKVIGTSSAFLYGERDRIRYEETNLGNFVTDIMRRHTGADIALLNSGSLRASIDIGPVTVAEVFQTMPYSNELVIAEITGAVLKEVLNRSVKGSRQDEDGGFLQVSGLTLTIKEHKPLDIMVGRAPLEPELLYRVAITDFMAEGGDGYSMFEGTIVYKTRSPLRELIVDTIREQGVVTAEEIARIRRIQD